MSTMPIDIPFAFGDTPVFATIQSAIDYWYALPIYIKLLIGSITIFLAYLGFKNLSF